MKHEVLVFNDVTLEVLNLDDLVLILEDIVLDVRFVNMVRFAVQELQSIIMFTALPGNRYLLAAAWRHSPGFKPEVHKI